jgi:hypothetical protein
MFCPATLSVAIRWIGKYRRWTGCCHWLIFKYLLFWHLCEQTDWSHEYLQSVYLLSCPRFKPTLPQFEEGMLPTLQRRFEIHVTLSSKPSCIFYCYIPVVHWMTNVMAFSTAPLLHSRNFSFRSVLYLMLCHINVVSHKSTAERPFIFVVLIS